MTKELEKQLTNKMDDIEDLIESKISTRKEQTSIRDKAQEVLNKTNQEIEELCAQGEKVEILLLEIENDETQIETKSQYNSEYHKIKNRWKKLRK